MMELQDTLTGTIKKIAKIVLIRPPVLELTANLSSYGAILPIGLAYIAAVLHDAGHQIKVIDAPGEAISQFTHVKSPVGALTLNGLSVEEIVQKIPSDTDLIGITHMFLHEWPTVKAIAEQVRSLYPKIKIILGGENATAFWPWIYKETNAVDYCILGEGESTIVKLVDQIINGGSLLEINGVATRMHHHDHNPPAPPKRQLQLANLPWPAWDYFPVENYMQTSDHHGVHRGRSIPMLATRGCPFQCTFCSSPQMWTTRYVVREPEDVVAEMKNYVSRYKINNVNFCDLTAIIEKGWIMRFCKILKRENLDITWQLPTGTRSEALDEEVLKLVYETGCRNITYAPESGSNRMLKIIKKKVSLSHMIQSLKAAKKASVVTRINIIIGHPKEERSDGWHHFLFMMTCAFVGVQDAAVMIFAPYPGSDDFKELMADGKITFNSEYYYLALARSGWRTRTYNSIMSTPELIRLQFLLLFSFYLTAYLTHPYRFILFLKSIISGNEETQLDQLIRTKLQRMIKTPYLRIINGICKRLLQYYSRFTSYFFLKPY
ncbi:MAG: B12-binding domain-containing radical SAM protein [Candidatus Omnitrophica bacterium]|nr:B12-binding domain-containing radical SAM protein [Candidatus Omnitrophota bacterium]